MMENLLTRSEYRRLHLITILARESEPIFLAELAERLGASVRVLKNDLFFFRNELDDFTIKSSQEGIQLFFKKNKGLKTISQKIIEQSIPYQVLEKIFLNEEKSVNEIAKDLFVSPSTMYRIINSMNHVLKDRGIQIETNPCRIIGEEQIVRYFAYLYFSERYSRLDWPYDTFEENIIDELLNFFITITKIPIDYAYYNIFKTVTIINLIRYKNKYYLNTDYITTNFDEVLPDLTKFQDTFKNFETHTGLKVNNHLIKQIFTPYVQDTFSLTYERLVEKTKRNESFKEEIIYLDQFLTELSVQHNIPLTNKKEVILATHNSAYLEYQEPRSGYILYNQHGNFVKTIEKEFPSFYSHLYKGVNKYRKLINVTEIDTEKGTNYLIYLIFTYWKDLILNLRKTNKKIQALIVSDRHSSHAYMLEDFLMQEFSTILETEVFTKPHLNESILEDSPHDLIVTNFPFPELQSKELVYIQNVPTHNDITRIQIAVNEIITYYELHPKDKS